MFPRAKQGHIFEGCLTSSEERYRSKSSCIEVLLNTANSNLAAACISVLLVIPAGPRLGGLAQQLKPLSRCFAAVSTVDGCNKWFIKIVVSVTK